MFEKSSGIFLVAGVGFFLLAFLSQGAVPVLMYAHLPERTVEETVEGNRVFLRHFRDLAERYPEQFEKHYYRLTPANEVAVASEALRVGRKVYTGEACWHCHSQFVRPVANEEKRWGPVARSWEYQSELQRPVLFGTRRIGPDLSRESGRKSNDWHATHFFNPRWTSPETVMPRYPWFFDGDAGRPNRRGLAMIAYMQYLGSWVPFAANQYREPPGDGVEREMTTYQNETKSPPPAYQAD